MSCWELPETLQVGGVDYRIRYDFRAALDIISALNDPDLPDSGKLRVMIEILYVEQPPEDVLEEAVEKAVWFLDCGETAQDDKPKSRTMDWEQDAGIIFPAINKIAGYEIRNPQKKTHWWTVMGFFYEIEDGVFSQVLSIRQKRAKGKKLDKWEREFLTENRGVVELKARVSEEEKVQREAEQKAVDALFNEVTE